MYLIGSQHVGSNNGLIYNTIMVVSGRDYTNPFYVDIHMERDIYSVINYSVMSNSYFNGYG